MNLLPPRETLRVLMLSDVYFPRINGVSTSIETFRRDLAAGGIKVELVAPDYPGNAATHGIRRIPAMQLPFDPEDRLMHWPALQRMLRDVGPHDFDLIHVQTPFAAHYAAVRLARRHHLPLLATYHTHFEEYFHHYLPLLPRPWLRGLARRLVRAQCRDYDAVVVPSQAMRATLAGYGVERPLHVLPTGIPVDMFAHGRGTTFRARHDIGPERKVALFVGRVAHEKNIGFLLEAAVHAARYLPSFLLAIAGDGPALPELRRQAHRLGLDPHVRFIGYLDRSAELADCYAAADVFSFASKTETQGLVLLEAMAAGVPAYALAELGTRDILEPRRGAVVAPDEPVAFAAGLVELLADARRRETLGAEARAWAAEWSAPGRAQQLAALYHRLAAARQPQPRHTTATCASSPGHAENAASAP